jgi:hypothetical protein
MHLVKNAKGAEVHARVPGTAPPEGGELGMGGAPGAPALSARDAAVLTPDGRVWGSGLMLTGGIGAFVMAATFMLPLVIFVGEMRAREVLPLIIATDALGAGAWVCIGLGALGGFRKTNGYSFVVSYFAWMAALFSLAGTVLMNAGGDTGQFFALVGFVAPFVAMLFFAIWGLAGIRGFGLGLGLPMGLCGILGSIAGLIAMMAIADSWRHVRDDTFKLFMILGVGLSVVSLVLGGIGMVGRLRRRPAS